MHYIALAIVPSSAEYVGYCLWSAGHRAGSTHQLPTDVQIHDIVCAVH